MKKHVDASRRVTILAVFLFYFTPLTATELRELKLEKTNNFHASATLNNSLGVGTFVSGYGQVPSLISSLTVSPSFLLPKLGKLPQMNLAAIASLNWRWLDSFASSNFNMNNRLSYSDVTFILSSSKILNFPDAGIFLDAAADLMVPISKPSRTLNRLVGFKVNTVVYYRKSDFYISWIPSFSSWIHSNAAMTGPCRETGSGSALPPVINPQNIDFELDQYLQELVISRIEERNSDGTCLVAGRQTIGSLTNTMQVRWAPGRHSISLSFGWHINYLRSLSNNTAFKGEHASLQNFTQATLGQVSYAYRIPVDFDLVISGGIVSYQASYSKQGTFNFPFFDFVTPGKNQTQFFLALTAGI
jgi:hypothetical protein